MYKYLYFVKSQIMFPLLGAGGGLKMGTKNLLNAETIFVLCCTIAATPDVSGLPLAK